MENRDIGSRCLDDFCYNPMDNKSGKKTDEKVEDDEEEEEDGER